MFFRVMDTSRLPDLVRGLSRDHEVIGPVAKEERFVFAAIDDPADLRLDYDTTLLPPKKLFFPPEDQMMRFRVADNEVLDDEVFAAPRVLLGLHPCDINALLLMDNIFLKDYVDPYYKARRDTTLVVGISCVPTEDCFCNSLGTDEAHWGFDIFLTDLGDRYFVSVRSVKGAELLDDFVETREITDADTAAFQRVTRERKDKFTQDVDTSQLPLLLDAKFDSPVWDELGERCLSCGACSMVCPTCYCFNVRDDLAPDQKTGTRTRLWDSCQFSEFAAVAHGQNFRESRASRVKYRYYHKQWGYLSKFERVLCVGCGRCSTACAADITPREVIAALAKGGVE
ncbi:MAG: 4Fe-4S dicluster domain-containing protein [Actinomycetota bacterium]|jgi:sulfhydrogenase subunit beta (sulfur reductase)|nr:4Fe-4S dicluster domain-containing protein [Actinomycetota bacterium]